MSDSEVDIDPYSCSQFGIKALEYKTELESALVSLRAKVRVGHAQDDVDRLYPFAVARLLAPSDKIDFMHDELRMVFTRLRHASDA